MNLTRVGYGLVVGEETASLPRENWLSANPNFALIEMLLWMSSHTVADRGQARRDVAMRHAVVHEELVGVKSRLFEACGTRDWRNLLSQPQSHYFRLLEA